MPFSSAAVAVIMASRGREVSTGRKAVVPISVLLRIVALAFCFVQVSGSDEYHPATFFTAQLADTGRSSWVSCQKNATVCKDKSKNPYGGETCCNKRLCRDLKYLTQSCGACNKYCAYGLVCCSGKCLNINNSEKNCGECLCAFGMCGSADDGEDESEHQEGYHGGSNDEKEDPIAK